MFTKIRNLKSDKNNDSLNFDSILAQNRTNVHTNVVLDQNINSLTHKRYSKDRKRRVNIYDINAQTYKSYQLGGIGPQVHSEEYKTALKRKQLMIFFANHIKKINDKRYKKKHCSASRNPHSQIFTNNGKVAIHLKPPYHKKNKSFLQGHEMRNRMSEFSKTIKRPKNVFYTEFNPAEGDRMKSMDENERLKQNQIIHMLFK